MPHKRGDYQRMHCQRASELTKLIKGDVSAQHVCSCFGVLIPSPHIHGMGGILGAIKSRGKQCVP